MAWLGWGAATAGCILGVGPGLETGSPLWSCPIPDMPAPLGLCPAPRMAGGGDCLVEKSMGSSCS